MPAVVLPTQGGAVGIGAEEGGEVPAAVRDAVLEPDGVEAQRVRLDLVAQPLLGPLDVDRHRAERAVVEMGDRRVEGEQQAGAGYRRRRSRLGHEPIIRTVDPQRRVVSDRRRLR